MTSTDLHAVFATAADGTTYRVSDPLSYGAAHDAWQKLDDDRRVGLVPQFKFFEVRSVWLGPDRALVGPEVRSHDRYDTAKVLALGVQRVKPGQRGFANERDGARAAWRNFAPTFAVRTRGFAGRTRERCADQGRGGWFYWPNGRTAAQGLGDLARLCKQRNLMVQGVDGRWYVSDLAL